MLLLCSTESYGTLVLMGRTLMGSISDRGEFDRPGKLARAMEEMKEEG